MPYDCANPGEILSAKEVAVPQFHEKVSHIAWDEAITAFANDDDVKIGIATFTLSM